MNRIQRQWTSIALAALISGTAWAAQPPMPTPEQRAQEAERRTRQDRMPDSPGTGRYPALKEELPSLPHHVLYRPADLAALGDRKLGVYVFGNGGCAEDGASSRLHLLEVASHGYLAIAPGRIYNGPGAHPVPPMPPPSADAPRFNTRTSYRDLYAALDWALAQNKDPHSPFHQRIDPKAIAVSGYSCGGAQAIRVAVDLRVKTLVVMNSGLFPDGSDIGAAEMEVPKGTLGQLHTPTLYIVGGETDIAWPQANDDYARINQVPVFYGNVMGVGHGGTYWEPNGGRAAKAVVAWLDWQLRGDESAASMFKGKECGLCADPTWSVQKKHID
ncbi:MAG: hypothetical protein RLZZ200_2502 [Pseudomonadota bacterium]|jgi:pimeloyl-ACP methyl ester carboxylesterase